MKNSINNGKQLNLFSDQNDKDNSNTSLSNKSENDFNKSNIISYNEFKHYSEKELRNKFFSLSDHLD